MRHFIRYNHTSKRVEAFSGKKPKGSNWQEVKLDDDCCNLNIPQVFSEFRTITINYLTPIGDTFRVTFIGEQGQGIYQIASDLSNSNTSEQLTLPDTGTYTVVLKVINATSGGSVVIFMGNVGFIGTPSLRPVVTNATYAGTGNSLLNTYNLSTAIQSA